MKINKVFQIDMDTEREPMLTVIQVSKSAIERSRDPSESVDMKDNMIALLNALAATVLQCEKQKIYKPGQGLRMVHENLDRLCMNAESTVEFQRVDEFGNVNDQLK